MVHYQACCLNVECPKHTSDGIICVHSIPHALEDRCFDVCTQHSSNVCACSMIITNNGIITGMLRHLGE